jgi:hypothetical protein
VAVPYNITVRADRDYYLPVNVQTGLGNPANLTGYLPVMTVKANIYDDDAHALFKSGPYTSNLPFGSFAFHIPRATNNGWWKAPPSGSGAISTVMVYDVSCADAATPAPNWNTLVEGSVTVVGPVTRTIP